MIGSCHLNGAPFAIGRSRRCSRHALESPEALVDWAMAEALAFGTLVAEGNHVRLSGQVRRGPCFFRK